MQSSYDKFISILNSSISTHIPIKLKQPHKRRRKPKHIKTLLKNKLQTYKELKLDSSKKQAYKDASKLYTSAVNQWHDQMEANLCTNPHSKKLYSYANRKLKIRNTIPPLVDDNKNIMFSDLDKANYLNHSFQKIFTQNQGHTIY